MENRSPRQAMLELLQAPDKRTKMGRFREIHELVEQAIHAGARRATIIATLRDAGLELSPATLNSYLTRLRSKSPAPPAPAPTAAKSPAPAVSPTLEPTAPRPTPDPITQPESQRPPTAIDFAEIRNRSHDLDKLSRQWRAKQRAAALAAKAGTTPDAAPPKNSDSG